MQGILHSRFSRSFISLSISDWRFRIDTVRCLFVSSSWENSKLVKINHHSALLLYNAPLCQWNSAGMLFLSYRRK